MMLPGETLLPRILRRETDVVVDIGADCTGGNYLPGSMLQRLARLYAVPAEHYRGRASVTGKGRFMCGVGTAAATHINGCLPGNDEATTATLRLRAHGRTGRAGLRVARTSAAGPTPAPTILEPAPAA